MSTEPWYDWTKNWFAPRILESPEIVRVRYFKYEHVGAAEGSSEQPELNQHMGFYEVDNDDWVWGLLEDMETSEHWRGLESSVV
jgi:hypothetical protein